MASLTPWLLDSRGNIPWCLLNRNINGPHSWSGGCGKAENLPLPPDSDSGGGDYDNDDKAMNRNSTFSAIIPATLQQLWHTIPPTSSILSPCHDDVGIFIFQ